MSAIRMAGAPAMAAAFRLAMSWARRLISAMLPAPSMTMNEKLAFSRSKLSRTFWKASGL